MHRNPYKKSDLSKIPAFWENIDLNKHNGEVKGGKKQPLDASYLMSSTLQCYFI